jgi:hypothetical protein
MISRNSCFGTDPLNKVTLLAMLPSHLDTTKAIDTTTGAVIDLTGVPITTIDPHLNDGSWVYYETLRPRQILLTNPHWTVLGFDPRAKRACVQLYTPSGPRVLSFDIKVPTWNP